MHIGFAHKLEPFRDVRESLVEDNNQATPTLFTGFWINGVEMH